MMNESGEGKENQVHSHEPMNEFDEKKKKIGLAAGALALLLLIGPGHKKHFPNDRFLMGVENRSGAVNLSYDHIGADRALNIDIIVKENADSGYIAYITKHPPFGKQQSYTIEAKDINELKSKLEYDLVTSRSDDISSDTEDLTKNKIISFAEAYDSFLKNSDGTFAKIKKIESRLDEIDSQIQELKKNKSEKNKQMIIGLRQERRGLEKQLETMRIVEIPYNSK